MIYTGYQLVHNRISYKLSLLTWKALHTAEPSYLSELISPYVPARTLCSSNTCLLAIPTGITSHFSSRSFSPSAPSTWNFLPVHICSSENRSTFKRQLKSHFFTLLSSHHLPAPLIRYSTFGLYKFICMYVSMTRLNSMCRVVSGGVYWLQLQRTSHAITL